MFLKNSRTQTEKRYEKLCREFPALFQSIEEKRKDCSPETALALKWLYSAMPYSDMANYPVEVFLDFAEHGARLYREKKAVSRLPEEIFRNYVLHHRVNEEEIRPCRSLFYGKLKPRLKGKEGAEAALEVNRWCGEEAVYRAGDERTLSALAVYERGYGRCGEESVFAVNALRSAGIPARQVYVPWWSHCDDNHAWVEVWVNGTWQYLGACEPQPVLNSGWFTRAASRAMLVHARWFDQMPPSGEEIIGTEGMVTMLNELRRYAPVCRVRVQVLEAGGSPAPGVRVCFQVLNFAAFYTVAEKQTDGTGVAELTTGLGSLYVYAWRENRSGEALLHLPEKAACQIRLKEEGAENWQDFDMTAPKGVDSLQPAREESHPVRPKGTWENPERRAFLGWLEEQEPEKAFWGRKMLDYLTEKDQTDCRFPVLKAHLEDAWLNRPDKPGREMAKEEEEEETAVWVLNPRVAEEVLTDYRAYLRDRLGEKEREQFRKAPELLWNWLEARVKECPEGEWSSLVTTPAACLKLGVGSRHSKEVLFVALARSLGVPARLRPLDGAPEYWRKGQFLPAQKEAEKTAWLEIGGSGDTAWKYGRNWSLARKTEEGYRTLNLEGQVRKDGMLELNLPAGTYRILTANRLPNGNLLARQCRILLSAGERRGATLELRQADLRAMLPEIELPEFFLRSPAGERVSSRTLTAGEERIFLWLTEGSEPTEHILNEILEQKGAFRKWEDRLLFVLGSEAALEDRLIRTLREALPGIRIFFSESGDTASLLSRSMYVEPGKFPLVLVTEGKQRGIYAVSGYSVGTGEMLLRIVGRGEGKEGLR